MKKFLVIGNPIEHSLSPKLHNYWIKSNNLKDINLFVDRHYNDQNFIKKFEKGSALP